MRFARRLMLIDIYKMFREDSLNGFQVIEQTRFCDRQTPGGKQCLPTLKGSWGGGGGGRRHNKKLIPHKMWML